MWEAGAWQPPTISWPYVGEVFRSLVGVLLAALAAWHWAPVGVAGMALATVGSATVAGAVALHDSPHARVPLVIGVSLGVGMTVLVGALTSTSNVAFPAVVILACASTGMCWAISRNAGLVATASCVVLVTCPPAPDVQSALRAAALTTAAGLLQVVLVAAWPRQRWRDQRRALKDAYGWVARGARRLADEPGAELEATPLLDLRAAYVLTETQARRRPPAHRGLHAFPERIAMTLNVLRADPDSAAHRDMLLAGADALDTLSGSSRAGRAGADDALRRLGEPMSAASPGSASGSVPRARGPATPEPPGSASGSVPRARGPATPEPPGSASGSVPRARGPATPEPPGSASSSMPTVLRRYTVRLRTSGAVTSILPTWIWSDVGFRIPPMQDSKVVFPHPLGPKRIVNERAGTSRSRPSIGRTASLPLLYSATRSRMLRSPIGHGPPNASAGSTETARRSPAQMWEADWIGLPVLAIILIGFFTDVKLPFGLPVGLAALLVGTAIGWIGGYMSAPDVSKAISDIAIGIPDLRVDLLWSGLSNLASLLGTAIALVVYNFTEAMSNVESAAAAGGRASYSLASGAVIGLFCFLGLFGVLEALLPVPAIMPILLYIGLLIGAQAFQAVPRLHAIAVVAALLPNLAQWASGLIDNALNAAATSADKVGVDALNSAGVVYGGFAHPG